MSQFTEFDFLLNAMENAAQQDNPADHDYFGKRRAVTEYVAKLKASALPEEEFARLKKIEHFAWHLMDASEEDAQTGAVTIRPMREDYDNLSNLLPEDHP